MLVLGVTGGVGSGKSKVLHYLRENFNAELIFADDLVKSMLSEDESLFFEIKNSFNNFNIFAEDGSLDRIKFADIVFNDKNKLATLNSIVHPAVKRRITEIIKEFNLREDKQALIIEAALLLEEEYDKLFDCIYIYANKDVRLERLRESRGYSDEKSVSIMNNQLPEEVFRQRCKYVVDNSGDFNDTAVQIDEILVDRYGLEKCHGKKEN